MAINASGLNILLQASTQQLQDLLQSLQPGAMLRGRIVDLLPDGKAVLNLQGQNLLAQLPSTGGASAFQKGDVLSLQVAPSAVPNAGAGSGAALTLRLVSNASLGSPAPSATTAPSSTTQVALPPQAVLEQALSAARLPVSTATLAVARVLASNGLPLDPQTLQSVVQAAESLLGTEQGVATSSAQAPASSPLSLSASSREALQEALPALRLALQSTPEVAPRLAYQQALNQVEAALTGMPPAATPALPPSNTGVTTAPQSSAPSEAVVPGSTPAQAVESALQSVLNDPSAANLEALQAALNGALSEPASAPALAPGPASTPSLQAGSVVTTAAASAGNNAALSIASLPVRRETAILLLSSIPPAEPGQPLLPATVIQTAQALSQTLSQAQSPEAQTLINAVQAQHPGSQPTQILQDAQTALNDVIEQFQALPAARPLPGPQALSAQLEAASVPVPQMSLSQLPRETVFEAVAWLKAHDLPPQRPLVEAAAQFLSRGQEALDLAQQLAQSVSELPEGLLAWRPGLQTALQNLEQAIQQSTLNMDSPDLAAQLQQWPAVSGLDMEKTLFQSITSGSTTASSASNARSAAPSTTPVPTLREALAQVQTELRQALRDPAGASAGVAPKLEQAASDASRALQSFSALPLQAQPSNNFHTVSLPLALPLNGPLGAGQLTVTWRQGHDKALNEKEPVNVAVALQTENLGEVRVLLQVWKGHASATVKAQDKGTADFLASGAAELKQGFAERTPFRLQSLDFGVSPATAPEIDEAPLPQSAGLNLSA